MSLKIVRVLRRVNVVRPLCDNLMGENHSHKHRITVGVVMMFIGVTVAKSGGEVHFFAVHFILDLLGYLIHGLGAVPIAEAMMAAASVDEKRKEEVKEEVKED